MDVTAAVAELSSQSGNIETVGLAVLGLLAIIVGFNYVKRIFR